MAGEVLVQEGDEVSPETIVARISFKPGVPWVIPLANQLGVEPRQLPGAMVKQVGDLVRTREMIAKVERGRYGRKDFLSPTDGVLEEVSDRSGRIIIREHFDPSRQVGVWVDVAGELGVKPKEAMSYLTLKVGDEVVRGSLLAKKGEAAAFFTKVCVAPMTGVITAIDAQKARVEIGHPFREITQNAHVPGTVRAILPGYGAVVETYGQILPGIFGVGGETYGRLHLIEGSELPSFLPTDAIVAIPHHLERSMLQALLARRVRGVIASSAHFKDLMDVLGVRLSGLKHAEMAQQGFVVLLTEGAGSWQMGVSRVALLRRYDGQLVALDGTTQIRAGAIRPTLILLASEPVSERQSQRATTEDRLKLGQQVRLLGDAHYGKVGRIVELPVQAGVLVMELMAPLVVIELVTGERLTVPRTNVEVYGSDGG